MLTAAVRWCRRSPLSGPPSPPAAPPPPPTRPPDRLQRRARACVFACCCACVCLCCAPRPSRRTLRVRCSRCTLNGEHHGDAQLSAALARVLHHANVARTCVRLTRCTRQCASPWQPPCRTSCAALLAGLRTARMPGASVPSARSLSIARCPRPADRSLSRPLSLGRERALSLSLSGFARARRPSTGVWNAPARALRKLVRALRAVAGVGACAAVCAVCRSCVRNAPRQLRARVRPHYPLYTPVRVTVATALPNIVCGAGSGLTHRSRTGAAVPRGRSLSLALPDSRRPLSRGVGVHGFC